MKQKDLRLIGGIPFNEMSGLLKDFFGKLGGHTIWELKMFLKRMNPFPKEREITVPEGMDIDIAMRVLAEYRSGTIEVFLERERLLKEWRAFYEKFFPEISSEKLDFSNLEIPKRPGWLNRLIVVAEGLTPNRLFAKCDEKFGASRYCDDLDAQVVSVRTTEKTYAIWVRDRVEADKENKGLSLDICQKSDDIMIREGITLEERLIFELIYWDETGKHLDLENWTLCSGSRDRDGKAVIVCWDSHDGLRVRWTGAHDDNGLLRARSVASSKAAKKAA